MAVKNIEMIKYVLFKTLDTFNIDVDYLMLEDSLHRQHPYKYAKLKKNVWEDIKKADIEINVESSLKTTFNIIQTNKNQEENK